MSPTEPKTRVYITIDTECREERPHESGVLPAAGYDARVWGRFSNQSSELGIRFIMDTLESHHIPAVFYLDPFGANSFGKTEFREVCNEILRRKHDLQLHAHPRQRNAYWCSEGSEPSPDRMRDYSATQQSALLTEARELFYEAGVSPDRLVSFRAGHFAANNDTLSAMAENGLTLSSNLNPCYQQRGECRVDGPEPPPTLFKHENGTWELPISNQSEGAGFRHMQITAVSAAELRRFLTRAHQQGASDVVVVTHSFEFFNIDPLDPKQGRPNVINRSRLHQLGAFLDRNRDQFEVTTMFDLNSNLDTTQQGTPININGSRLLYLLRVFEQALKRIDMATPAIAGLLKLFYRSPY